MPKHLCIVWVLLSACRAASDARPSTITAPRVLAWQSEPAEAAPGARVTFSILAADGGGELDLDAQALRLGFCRTPKQLGDNRAVSDDCAEGFELDITGSTATVPDDACTRFGPNVAAGVRPPDPDATGGYYQPIRIALGPLTAIAALRLQCPLTDAPFAVTRAYRERYTANRAPELTPLTASRAGERSDLGTLPAAAELTLQAGWSPESEERYVLYDRAAGVLRERSEALRISWFASAGELTHDHSEQSPATNTFRSPSEPGPVHLWLVLRDDRGAMSYASYVLEVQ